MSSRSANPIAPRFAATTVVIVLGALLAGTFAQTCLSSSQFSSNFISPSTWYSLTKPYQPPSGAPTNSSSIELPLTVTFVPCLIVSLTAWFVGAFWIAKRRQISWSEALILWGWYGWLWWCLVDVWEWIWLVAGLMQLTSLVHLLTFVPQIWFAGCIAGWITTGVTLGNRTTLLRSTDAKPIRSKWLWLSCGLYFITFTAMNWSLYWNLLVPHGDSAMYEEHLWNLLHGKGFRSYLDQGLFLGEHIQFVHLFLLPLYLFWPSHLLLEACSSAALALGAFPVFWMVRRHSNSDRTAFAVAVAYLLYFPMQFLDIEIDLKTFRPESFGIPLLLLTLDQLDRRNMVGTILGILGCLTVKEDYAIIFGPLGLWIALSRSPMKSANNESPPPTRTLDLRRNRIVFGLCLCLSSVLYLWLATRVVMPWFRSGVEVHYASYFARFGKSPEAILNTMLTNPKLVFDSLFTTETALYAIAILSPLAFLPLLSPGRLTVGLPLFAILCLNELEGSRSPQHQFHAPLVAIVFWSLAAATPRARFLCEHLLRRFVGNQIVDPEWTTQLIGRLVWTSSFATGIFFSLGPLGITFWDPGSSWNWRLLYAPSQRAKMFSNIEHLIPHTARVASTDFVHPRFTHYERSYDYSGYQRKVSGEGRKIPEDTDYLVIDTQHRYSTIKRPEEIPELREEPDQWELLPDQTEGFFIVLRRKNGKHSTADHPVGSE